MDSMESLGDLLAKLKEYFATHPAPAHSLSDTPDQKIIPPDPLRFCGVPEPQRHKTFETFSLTKAPKLQEAYEAAWTLSHGGTAFNLVLLYGKGGTGKTHLCYAAAIAAKLGGIKGAFYTTFEDLLAEFKGMMDTDPEDTHYLSPERYWQGTLRRGFIAVDDIGLGSKMTDWSWGRLEDLVDYRYRYCLPTLLSTNLDLHDLPGRVVRRCRDVSQGQVIFIQSYDFSAG